MAVTISDKFRIVIPILLIVLTITHSHTAVPFRHISGDSAIYWAQRMADSDIQRNPQAWMLDFQKKPKWNYTHGLVLLAMERLWQKTGEQRYYDYIKDYADLFVDQQGNIRDYNKEDYSLDKINAGRCLFFLYDQTGDEKYEKAILRLSEQFERQPRTKEGGFWHKKRYPYQMWLDGLYMGMPFYAQYAREFDQPDCFDDIILQFNLIEKHTRDRNSGLLYHGWDESRKQRWADPGSGLSPHIWGRGVGWFAMALVDVLDYLPLNHPGRADLIDILQRLADAVNRNQDQASGLWYQVMNQAGREGNYLESSASTMFVYALIKAVRKEYIDALYEDTAVKGMKGIMHYFISVDDKGLLDINQCCAGAGLGGDPYRDGSYQYYITTDIRSNDPKAVGPFILAWLEFDTYLNIR